MEERIIDFFLSTFLFSGIEREACRKILSAVRLEECNFQKNDLIFSPCDLEKKIGFVFSGACSVKKLRPNTEAVELNELEKGGSFGIISVFSEKKEFPTSIYAKRQTKIIFISADDVKCLVKRETSLAMNVILFLADRIAFLNEKINTFSASSTEKKLAKHLISSYRSTGLLTFAFNKKHTASTLACGRASLYRVLDDMTKEGIIEIDNKNITIKCPAGLERIAK